MTEAFVPQNRRITGIDGLRAIAILLVMTSHAGLGRLVPGGFGVTVFFFLSGYLITTLLRMEFQAHGTIDFKAFYVRRALRILPPLYLTLALTCVLMAAGWLTVPINAQSLALDIMFLTNYSGLITDPSNTPIPLWSLDVEEHFYLFFPLIYSIIARHGGRRQLATLTMICAVVLLARVVTYPTIHRPDIYYWTHTRVDSIILGAVLAIWQNPHLDREAWRPGRAPVAAAFAVLLLTFVVRSDYFRETVRYTLQGIALFVLFSAAIQSRGVVSGLLESRLMRAVALLSYTLYLIHLPLLKAFSWLGPIAGPFVAYALSFAWSTAVYFVVERPLARWRKRDLAARVTADGPQPTGAPSG